MTNILGPNMNDQLVPTTNRQYQNSPTNLIKLYGRAKRRITVHGWLDGLWNSYICSLLFHSISNATLFVRARVCIDKYGKNSFEWILCTHTHTEKERRRREREANSWWLGIFAINIGNNNDNDKNNNSNNNDWIAVLWIQINGYIGIKQRRGRRVNKFM